MRVTYGQLVRNNINLIVRSPDDKTFRSSRCYAAQFSLFPSPSRRMHEYSIIESVRSGNLVTRFDLFRPRNSKYRLSFLFFFRQGLKRFIFQRSKQFYRFILLEREKNASFPIEIPRQFLHNLRRVHPPLSGEHINRNNFPFV